MTNANLTLTLIDGSQFRANDNTINEIVDNLEIGGVRRIEWRFKRLAVQFVDKASFDAASQILGWQGYPDTLILIGLSTAEYGHDDSRIIVKGCAYDGFWVA